MAGEIDFSYVGNLTADPELRYTQNGKAVASICVAVTPRVYSKQSGAFEDGETTFLRGSIWGALGENAAASLVKGSRVIVQGVLRQRQYETAEGEKRTVFEVTVGDIGPSLQWGTAAFTRTVKAGASADAAPDAWATPSASTGDESPF